MKFTELQKRTSDDLEKDLAKTKMDLMKYRAQAATGGSGKETGKVRTMKRTIARILTIKNKSNKKEATSKQ